MKEQPAELETRRYQLPCSKTHHDLREPINEALLVVLDPVLEAHDV